MRIKTSSIYFGVGVVLGKKLKFVSGPETQKFLYLFSKLFASHAFGLRFSNARSRLMPAPSGLAGQEKGKKTGG